MNWNTCVTLAVVLLGMTGLMPVAAQPEIVGNRPATKQIQPAVIQPDNNKRGWGPEQATGAPDTPQEGDFPTAWASLKPDDGPEWLQVEYARPVAIKEVRIRESFNPGAVKKVTAFGDDDKEKTLWEGEDPTKQAPTDFVVQPKDHVTAKRVKIYLDAARVPGWNEIDAVELVGMDDTRQWAVKATASSSYAERPPDLAPMPFDPRPEDEFSAFVNLPILCRLPGDKHLEGVLLRSGPQFLVINNAAAHTVYVVNKTQIIFAEIKQEPVVLDAVKLQ